MTGDLYTALSVSELGRTHPRSHKKREQLTMVACAQTYLSGVTMLK